jgi:glycosyl transferase family 1
VGDRHVFFGDWLPYDQRVNVLLDADLAVSTHHDHVETRYSFRTRLLDALWAGLPVVTTAGDALADAVTAAGAGVGVPSEDVPALAAALEGLLADGKAREGAAAAARSLADGLRWSTVLGPLVAYCAAPRRSPDRADPDIAAVIARGGDLARPGRVQAALDHVRKGEWSTLWEQARRRAARGT